MVRLKHKLSEPPPAPERGVKAATFRLLLDTAMQIIRESGHIPSVADVAARSRISRASSSNCSIDNARKSAGLWICERRDIVA